MLGEAWVEIVLAVTEVALPFDAALRLAGLRSDTGLELPDRCVVLPPCSRLRRSSRSIAGSLPSRGG